MKIKGDFITNSSSAAYMFVFKGDHKIDLYKAMLDCAEQLNITGEDYDTNPPYDTFPLTITAIDIIKSMDHLIKNDRDPKELWIKPGIVPLDQAIDFYTKDLESIEYSMLRSDHPDWYKEDIKKLKSRLKLFAKAKEEGFTSMAEVDFGNDGAVSEHPVGTIMRQKSYDMNELHTDCLILATEERS